ncbi:hypothetical protein F0L17_26620 [Streptomyces sp. TRM43335]|uniref:Uncharacterized protein n=1 Tax=Streptomyces taklimakanensis TaxID=2569853 RepID=A0A6G2BJZ2_9ACTN|nr:hypothetical protein [Streptomyces taklimakanensis]MTE22605.1 hypothetical protein [Streptomyces taklimakanensis]
MFDFTRVRRAARTVSDAVRSVVAPAALVRTETVPDPADAYGPEEMPAPEAIETAAADYAAACDQARAADRGKRRAKKTLGRLPAGRYGRWLVERVPSSRQTPDLEAIRATYARLGLGDVPMRPCAPSLRVTELVPAALPVPAADEPTAALAA